MPLTLGTICSGIGAPEIATTPLGWRHLWCSEIEEFPSAVLAERFPEAVNLGDMTAGDFVDRACSIGIPDVIIGGTPCQSFSVAGKKKGLNDPRGNLTFVFLEIIKKIKPKWVIWENVPNVISIDNGDVLRRFLDELQSFGYIIDCDILDAVRFGVPQRRKRIFVVCQSVETLVSRKTNSSVLTIIQCMLEILRDISTVTINPSLLGSNSSNLKERAKLKSSLLRKMILLGAQTEKQVWRLESCSDEILQLLDCEPDALASLLGNLQPEKISGDIKSPILKHGGKVKVNECQSIELSLRKLLEESLMIAKEFITLTDLKEITESKIYSCALLTALIIERIILSPNCCPRFWSAKSSGLTALRGFTDYARKNNRSLFGKLEWISRWNNFIFKADERFTSLSNLREECPPQVPSKSKSLRWNSSSRQTQGEDASSCAGTSSDACGLPGLHYAPEHANCLKASDGGPDENTTMVCYRMLGFGDYVEDDTASTLKARDYKDATDLVVPLDLRNATRDPEKLDAMNRQGCGIGNAGDPSPTITAKGSVPGVAFMEPLPFDTTQVTSKYNYSNPKAGDPCHPLSATGHPPVIAFSCKDYGGDAKEGIAPTLRAMNFDKSHINGGGQVAVAFCENEDAAALAMDCRHATLSDTTHPVQTGETGVNVIPHVLCPSMIVRRLIPLECERLQGFPDGHTDIIHKGKPASDTVRYKAIGNSMAVPILAWICKRIEEQELEKSL